MSNKEWEKEIRRLRNKETSLQQVAVNPIYCPIPPAIEDYLRAVNHWEIIEQAACPNLQYEFEVYL